MTVRSLVKDHPRLKDGVSDRPDVSEQKSRNYGLEHVTHLPVINGETVLRDQRC